MRRMWGIAWCLSLGAVSAAAHEDLSTYVHHVATFSVDAHHIDVTVRLTFYESIALAERARMDADDDGRITGGELRAYTATLIDETVGAACIREGAEKLLTAPLYDPEVDVQGDWTRSTTPVVIQVVYFARRTAHPPLDADISLEDTLWSAAPALCITRGSSAHKAITSRDTPVRTGAGEIHRHAVHRQPMSTASVSTCSGKGES